MSGDSLREYKNTYPEKLVCECDRETGYEIDYKDKQIRCTDCGHPYDIEKVRGYLIRKYMKALVAE